jgi:hypothetical protein
MGIWIMQRGSLSAQRTSNTTIDGGVDCERGGSGADSGGCGGSSGAESGGGGGTCLVGGIWDAGGRLSSCN